ncbi:MAG: hypothetical protein ACK5NT_08455 [Pyrinomonadaceae bacterium]
MIKKITFTLSLFAIFSTGIFAQVGQLRTEYMNPSQVESIIRTVTKNEDDFRNALTNYVFNRKATIQTIGLGGLITGTFRRDSFMTFTTDGQRFERITYAPPSTLREISITPADLEDLGGVNPFAINPQDMANYVFDFVGKQKIDDLDLLVFDVRPRTLPKFKTDGKRYFSGRIWVDSKDLMIVKSKGKGVPEDKDNKFPIVETWRINVDGKYWFPAYTASDDELVFGSGQVVRLRIRVTYDDYKQGRSEVKILDDPTPVKETENTEPTVETPQPVDGKIPPPPPPLKRPTPKPRS